MSRTRHVRSPRKRTNPLTSPKKPDGYRRWVKRNVHTKVRAPRDVRRDPPRGSDE